MAGTLALGALGGGFQHARAARGVQREVTRAELTRGGDGALHCLRDVVELEVEEDPAPELGAELDGRGALRDAQRQAHFEHADHLGHAGGAGRSFGEGGVVEGKR